MSLTEITISNQLKQPLLQRTQVSASVSFEGVVPSRIEVRKLLAQKVGKPEAHVIVHHILPGFATGSAVVKADVYDNADVMKKLIDKFTTIRHMPKDEKIKIKDEMKAAKQAAKAAKQAAKK